MKTGLIVEGGGMKCAYSAGVLDEFLDEQLQFDYCIGVSAGSANCASFLAGQRGRNLRYYTQYVKDPRYLSVSSWLKTGSLFGLQYIYGELSNEGGRDPLDFDAYHANPTEAFVAATEGKTGKTHYFNKNEIRRNDYEPIMASCALPVACRPIVYQGHSYFDGGVSDSIPVRHALDWGCDRIVIILSKPRGFRMHPQSHRIPYSVALARQYPRIVEDLNHRHQVYNQEMDLVDYLVRVGRAKTFCPSGQVKIGTYTTDPVVMQQLYDNGLQDAKKRKKEIKEFLYGE
jgi:predicted patatin/cPLA2 family phospholipase